MKKFAFFEQKLKEYYRSSHRDLPWRRRDITAYEVWMSEILLQQTQVARVVSFYENMLKRFPDVQSLAEASWEDFLPYYQGLGYYRRGRNMLATAKIVQKKFGGVFPQDAKKLRSLPGIGEYTASAILAFAYNKNTLAWDTNLKKVFGRFLFGKKDATLDTINIEKHLTTNKRMLNAAIMDFSNHICVRTPHCDVCPLQTQCNYFETRGKQEKKSTRRSLEFPIDQAQVYLFLHKDHKEYYSPNQKKFAAFILPPEKNTRAAMKKYFLDMYQLHLAIRPPHQKIFLDNQPTILVNAQILLGKHNFTSFQPEAKKNFMKRLQPFIREEE